jgi:hypothetical protein
MHVAVVALVLLGIFTEVRTPKKGFECLYVQYKGNRYLAKKFERSRITGRVTLTMPPPNLTSGEEIAREILGQKILRSGREIELSGFEIVTDSNNCTCVGRRCADR